MNIRLGLVLLLVGEGFGLSRRRDLHGAVANSGWLQLITHIRAGELDSYALADELATRFAKDDAIQLADAVAKAKTPLVDFGERLWTAVQKIFSLYEEQTADEEDTDRADARQQLLEDLTDAFSAAHADHLAALRQAAVADLAKQLRALNTEFEDESERIRAWATLATDVEMSFRASIDQATPPLFLPLLSSSLEASLDALREDFRDTFEECELSRPVYDLDDLDTDDDNLEENSNNVENENPLRYAARILAGSPRLLRAAGFALNLLQARAAIRAAKHAAFMRDETLPKFPLLF